MTAGGSGSEPALRSSSPVAGAESAGSAPAAAPAAADPADGGAVAGAGALARIVIVLSRTQHPGNIGSAARAMLTMGLAELRLVSPQKFPDAQANAMASAAQSVLDAARIYDSLAVAVEDCALVIGSSSRRRYLGDEPLSPADAAATLLAAAAETTEAGPRVALVFGCERTGLTNEELDYCHRLTTIPSNPVYPSLNLAAAVQVFCWELRRAAIAPQPISLKSNPEWMGGRFAPSTAEQMEQFYEHFERALLGTGFLDPLNPGLLMRRLRHLFGRARPDSNELNILRGILKSIESPKERTPRPRRGARPAATPPADPPG